MKLDQIAKRFRIDKPDGFKLADYDPGDTAGLTIDKGDAKDLLKEGIEKLSDLQERLYAMVMDHGHPPGRADDQYDQTYQDRIDESGLLAREHKPQKKRRYKGMHGCFRVTHNCQSAKETRQEDVTPAILLIKTDDSPQSQQHKKLTRAACETSTHHVPRKGPRH